MKTHRSAALLAAALCAAPSALAAAPQNTKPVGSSAAPKTAPRPDVVGRVANKAITWDELVARMRRVNPTAFQQAVSQAVAASTVETLYGKTPKPQITFTQASALAALRKQPTPAVVTFLTEVLREEAIFAAARKINAVPSDAQTAAHVNRVLKLARERGAIPPNVTDAQFLASRKISRATLQKQFKPYIAVVSLMGKELETRIGHRLSPDDYVQARHVLVSFAPTAPDAKPEEKEKARSEAKAKAQQLAEDIKAGKKTFEEAAAENNQDSTRTQGGDLGAFVRGNMVKEFETAAFALKPNEVSQPVETQFGYHLIRVDKTGKDLTPDQRFAALEKLAGDPNRFNEFTNGLLQRGNAVNELMKLLPPNPNMGMGMSAPGR